jgi:hypothetical protein
VGQFVPTSITDPSGHVLVVVDDVNVRVHDGSVGFFVQSTGGEVPLVQLFTHVDPAPDPADGATVMLVGGVDVVLVMLFGIVLFV